MMLNGSSRSGSEPGRLRRSRGARDVALGLLSLIAIPVCVVSMCVVAYRFFPVPWDLLLWLLGF